MADKLNFYEILTAAINDMMEHGYDSIERVTRWVSLIKQAAYDTLVPLTTLNESLGNLFRGIYHRQIEKGQILRYHGGIDRFTFDKLKPSLQQANARALAASRSLIKDNREQAVNDTAQRFQGWGTSIPPGGTSEASRAEERARIRKPLASLPYKERLVINDQGHKFVGNLNNIIAVDGGALALTWHSNFRQAGYDYRPDHKERDGVVYVIRNSWALEKGLIKVDGHTYYDQITAVGQEINCRCHATYLYNLRSLPPDMLTAKGKAELQRVRIS